MPIVECPRCQSELDVETADLGHTVECPQCQSVFPAVAKQRVRHWDDRRDDDDPEGFYRGRDELDPRNRSRDMARAEAIVAKPANALATTAGIAVVLCVIGGVIMAVLGVNMIDNGGVKQQGDGIALLFYAVCVGVFGTAIHAVMWVGANKAKSLHSTGWAYTAAIMGISAIALCGPCTIFSIFTTWFGIWLITAMSKPEVVQALRWNKEGPPRHRGSPLEDDDAPR